MKFSKFQIQEYFGFLARKYPNIVQRIQIGQSVEKRTIELIKIGNLANSGNRGRPAFWLDAGIHAREWITPAVALYIIDQVCKKFS